MHVFGSRKPPGVAITIPEDLHGNAEILAAVPSVEQGPAGAIYL
jgi:hypothetical protein